MDEISKESFEFQSGNTKAASRSVILQIIGFMFALVVGSCAQSETSGPVTTALTETAPEIPSEAGGPGSDSVEVPAGDESIQIVWRESDLSGESFFDDLMATANGYRVYRFAHGPRAWTSQDGIAWTPQELQMVTSSEQIAVYSVVRGGPGFLASGTDSPTPHPDAEDGDEMLWVSGDGFTWEKQEIELETPKLGVFAETGSDELVSSSDGLLIVGRLDRGPGGPDEHSFVLWASDDGVEWDLIENPFPAGAYVDVQPAPHGFIATGFVESGEEPSDSPIDLWSSSDGGYSWVNIDTEFLGSPPPSPTAAHPAEPQFTMWNERLLVGANTEDGIRLWSSVDTQTWEPLPTSGVLAHTDEIVATMDRMAAGPGGIVILGGIEPRFQEPERSPLELEKEGRKLLFDPDTELLRISDLETGAVILEALDSSMWDQIIVEEEESISFLDPETDETLLSFGPEEWFPAMEEAGWLVEGPSHDSVVPVLWFSPDGERWTIIDVEKAVGIVETPNNVVVGDNAVILHWSGWSVQDEYEHESEDGEDEFEEDPPDVMWVGIIDESN